MITNGDHKSRAFIGIDVGTQGARVVAVDEHGHLLSKHRSPLPLFDLQREHDPDMWWRTAVELLKHVGEDLQARSTGVEATAISVVSTSGTVIPVDRNGVPVHPALMYSDDRASDEARLCHAAFRASADRHAFASSINASYGLPKILWFLRNHDAKASRIHRWIHAADYVLGRLSGVWGFTDQTNALKTGFDVFNEEWPEVIWSRLGVPRDWLPKVVASGTVLGRLSSDASETTGLPRSIVVTAGMTDGCGSQVAAGAVRPGNWNTTIGTTMVVKGTTHEPILDPLGRIYNHRHPQGLWMPGGASYTGADWISQDYPGHDLRTLDAAARLLTPTGHLSYPLRRAGERFPFIASSARGFDASGLTEQELYTARLEGVAYIERLSYELVEHLSGERVSLVSSAGGASRSDVWLQLRSNVLQRPIVRMRLPEAAVGAAIIAASGTHFSTLDEAVQGMTSPESTIHPNAKAWAYEAPYAAFVEQLATNGYLDESFWKGEAVP